MKINFMQRKKTLEKNNLDLLTETAGRSLRTTDFGKNGNLPTVNFLRRRKESFLVARPWPAKNND